MNRKSLIKLSAFFLLFFLGFLACKQEEYTLGELTAPENLVINTVIVGQSTTNPNGDGSGNVNITATAKNALAYKIGYTTVSDLSSVPDMVAMPAGKATIKFNQLGDITYRITVIAYGKGGSATTTTKDITVKSIFNPDPTIVTNLTNNASKTWKVDQSSAGHFGVGPWSATSVTPEWWSAGPNEKVVCCNCFYTARFTFTKISSASYTLQDTTPDGAFTKTGALASIPGIPASGDEGCYPYAGGTSPFSFIQSTSGVVSTTANPTTSTSILLGGTTTFIGYGALQKEYEILVITPTYLYLRVRGTETGNAWYLKLIPA